MTPPEAVAEKPCRVVLIGMMGSGKSTVGRKLAERTGWRYVDNDDLTRRFHGSTARQLLADRGEAVMRAAESDALVRALEEEAPVIVGAAAGTILDAASREGLRDGGIVVYLRADPGALERRAPRAEHRPWVDTGGASWIRRTAEERDPLYASVADLTVDTSRDSASRTADAIAEWLRSVPSCAVSAPRGRRP